MNTVPVAISPPHLIRPHAWFAVLDEDQITLAVLSGYDVATVRSTRLPQPLHNIAHWIAKHVQREALVLGFPLPPLVQFCGRLDDPLLQTCDGMVFQRLDIRPRLAAPCADGPGIQLALSGAP